MDIDTRLHVLVDAIEKLADAVAQQTQAIDRLVEMSQAYDDREDGQGEDDGEGFTYLSQR